MNQNELTLSMEAMLGTMLGAAVCHRTSLFGQPFFRSAWRLPFFQLTVVVALTRSVNEDSRDVISCVAVECDGMTEDTVSLLMTAPKNPEKSNNALGPATGGGGQGGQLGLGQVSNFLSKSSEPDRMPHPDHFDETWDRLSGKIAKFPLCRTFPKYCDVKEVTWKVEVLSGAMMWESLLGVGGVVVTLQILMFYIAGVCWNTGLLDRLWPRVFGDLMDLMNMDSQLQLLGLWTLQLNLTWVAGHHGCRRSLLGP